MVKTHTFASQPVSPSLGEHFAGRSALSLPPARLAAEDLGSGSRGAAEVAAQTAAADRRPLSPLVLQANTTRHHAVRDCLEPAPQGTATHAAAEAARAGHYVRLCLLEQLDVRTRAASPRPPRAAADGACGPCPSFTCAGVWQGLPPLPRVFQPGRPDPQVRPEHLPPVLPRV